MSIERPRTGTKEPQPTKESMPADARLGEARELARIAEIIDSHIGLKSSSEPPPMIDVIAKLKDPLEHVDGLNVTRRMGQLVAGTVAIAKIEAVRDSPNVISLKAATPLVSRQPHSLFPK